MLFKYLKMENCTIQPSTVGFVDLVKYCQVFQNLAKFELNQMQNLDFKSNLAV